MKTMRWKLSENWKVLLKKSTPLLSLFYLKDKVSHVTSVVYEGKCNCGENYIGEKGRNITVRLAEHSDTAKKSEPAKHLH